MPKLKLQTKIILSFSLLPIAIIITFSIFLNNYVYDDIESEMTDNLTQLGIKISEQVDSYIANVDQVAKNILSNKEVTIALSNLAKRKQTLTHYETITYSRTLEETMGRMLALSSIPQPYSYIFSANHQYSFAYYPLESHFSDIREKDPYIGLLLSKKKVVYPHNANSEFYSGTDCFSLIRAIYDLNAVLHGFIELQQDYSELDKICDTGDTGTVFIIGPYKEILYPATKISSKDRKLLLSLKGNEDLFRDKSGNLFSCVQSEYTGFTVVVKHANKDVFAPLYLIQQTATFIIAIMALLALLSIWIIAKILVRPIRALRDNILRISYDNMQLDLTEQNYTDELTLFNYTFQSMLNGLKDSMERELTLTKEEAKARFSALQAQISPHFIHNILYVISISAQKNRPGDVALMCKQLSNMLRYVVDSPFTTVCLEDEIGYTMNYLSLQKRHYEDFLNYKIDIDPAAKTVMLPRLVIQPFVENSIQHGFSQKAPPWHIQITATVLNGSWCICISDNGQGIKADMAQELDKKLNGMQADILQLKNPDDPGMNGIGVINTVMRLKLMYKDELSFTLRHNTPSGLTIVIQGPVDSSLLLV